jgi:hypothetical protein
MSDLTRHADPTRAAPARCLVTTELLSDGVPACRTGAECIPVLTFTNNFVA